MGQAHPPQPTSAARAQDAPAGALAADAGDVCGYVEDMVMDLASMASRAGETSLSASLALVGLQAGAARRRHMDAA